MSTTFKDALAKLPQPIADLFGDMEPLLWKASDTELMIATTNVSTWCINFNGFTVPYTDKVIPTTCGNLVTVGTDVLDEHWNSLTSLVREAFDNDGDVLTALADYYKSRCGHTFILQNVTNVKRMLECDTKLSDIPLAKLLNRPDVARVMWNYELETVVGEHKGSILDALIELFHQAALAIGPEIPTYRKLVAKPHDAILKEALAVNLTHAGDSIIALMRRAVTNLPEMVLDSEYVYDAAYSIKVRKLRDEVLIALYEMEEALR